MADMRSHLLTAAACSAALGVGYILVSRRSYILSTLFGMEPRGKVINGKEVAAAVRAEVKERVRALEEEFGAVPGLAVVIVGDRKDSQTYVRMKQRMCAEIGMRSLQTALPEEVTQEELLAVVEHLNADDSVHGILVQLPLPSHIDEQAILSAISIEKDVDGFHPLNIGRLAMKGREPLFVPCTPKGCLELLKRSNCTIRGKHAVIIGRSNVVGMPAALLLVKADATVTITHSHTVNMPKLVRQADIVIAAAGRANMVKAGWLKPNCVVIDVGTNAVDDDTKKAGYRLVGDVDYRAARHVVARITPVPGGVGPMTIAMLLLNTCESGERAMREATGQF